MTKTFCDRCGEEINEDDDFFNSIFGKDLCHECFREIANFVDDRDNLSQRYDTLRNLCLKLFGREQAIRHSEMPSRAAIAKKLYDDQELADIKDKIWDEVNVLSGIENWR